MTDTLPPTIPGEFDDDEFDWARDPFTSPPSDSVGPAVRRGDAVWRPQPPTPLTRRQRRRGRRGWRRRWIAWPVYAFTLFEGAILSLNFVTPPRTMFMIDDPHPDVPFVNEYVELDHISRWLLAAVVLHEDAEFGTRILAFDVDHFIDRIQDRLDGKKDTSGSTIPQQLAKNLFFTRWSSPLRKALEVPIAFSINFLVADQRILELYLNEAQFAQNLYGVCPASWYYFNSAPWDLTQQQAIELAGLLPAGDYARRAPGGGIDLTNPESSATQTVWHASEILPLRFDEQGGSWQAAIAPLGITDTAADHAADRDHEDSCSQMPRAVADRIDWEDSNRVR